MDNTQSKRNKLLDSAITELATTAKLCRKYLDGEDSIQALDDLESCVQEYSILDITSTINANALQNTEAYYRNPDNNISLPTEKVYANAKKALQKPISNSDINNHAIMRKYKENIEENGVEISQADNSVVASNDFVPPVDPITKATIRNPVRNSICGHIYEDEIIRSLITKKNTRCPYIGCPALQYIQFSHLDADVNLKRQIDAYHSQHL